MENAFYLDHLSWPLSTTKYMIIIIMIIIINIGFSCGFMKSKRRARAHAHTHTHTHTPGHTRAYACGQQFGTLQWHRHA